jgi:parvulin-like peptidyl-prolyl isomerase
VAATVNGSPITVGEVEAMRISESGAIPEADFVETLTNAIVELVVVDEAKAQFGIEATEAETEAKYQDLKGQIEAGGATLADFLTQQRLPDAQFRRIAAQQVIRDKLIEQFRPGIEEVTDQDAQFLLDAEINQRTMVCALHILVATLEEAEAVKARLDAGEDFAAVATEVSTDTGSGANGGDLGCAAPSGYVPEFAQATLDAEIGKVTDPVQSQFGFHLILVEDRTVPTLEQLKGELGETRAQEKVQEWLLETMKTASIEVEARYGQWVTEPFPQILPPPD